MEALLLPRKLTREHEGNGRQSCEEVEGKNALKTFLNTASQQ